MSDSYKIFGDRTNPYKVDKNTIINGNSYSVDYLADMADNWEDQEKIRQLFDVSAIVGYRDESGKLRNYPPGTDIKNNTFGINNPYFGWVNYKDSPDSVVYMHNIKICSHDEKILVLNRKIIALSDKLDILFKYTNDKLKSEIKKYFDKIDNDMNRRIIEIETRNDEKWGPILS
jgi:hypothetical protein